MQSGWLIEKNNGDTKWLKLENGNAEWTTNAAEGLRFARQQDADRFAQHFFAMSSLPKGYSITEHSWG